MTEDETKQPVRPEVVDDEGPDDPAELIDGSKLMRIAAMTRAMLEEVRDVPLDEEGRRQLRDIHAESVAALEDVLPGELRDELAAMMAEFEADTVPSGAELRIAQAQLVGWLEGVFNGIHAALATQQMVAQAQLAGLEPRKGLPAGPGGADGPPGAYL